MPTDGIPSRATTELNLSNLMRSKVWPTTQLIALTRSQGGLDFGVTVKLPSKLTLHFTACVRFPLPLLAARGMTAESRLHFVLDCAFYALRVCRPPPEGHPSLGETIASAAGRNLAAPPTKARSAKAIKMAPSTLAAVEQLCSSDLYTNRPPELTATYYGSGPSFYTAWHKGLQACQSLHPVGSPKFEADPHAVSFAPVATVEHDNRYLFWGIDTPLCASGNACAATTLEMNQGPLHAYRIPGDAKPQPFCLLCIRQDVEGLVMSVAAKSKTAGCVPVITPPFKNPVGPGGYDESAFGVTPHNQSVFVGNTWIVKASGALMVRLDPASRRCFVDQGPLVYGAAAASKND